MLSEIQEVMRMFNDRPLTRQEMDLFVNRFDELNKLKNIGLLVEYSIYGVTGETGSGKSTLFNMLNFSQEEEIKKIQINITEKESKEIIITDLLSKLCTHILKDKELSCVHKKAEEVVNFIREEEIKGREKGFKLGKIIEGEKKWVRTYATRFTLSTIKARLEEIIKAITRKGKFLFCIDEIDKETKKEVIIILDSLKEILLEQNLVCLIALPQIMYHQYLEDRTGLLKEGNLENILKDIVPLHPLPDEDIYQLLERRTGKFPEVLPEEIREVVIDFAEGNPREALLLCQNSLLAKHIAPPFKIEDAVLGLDDLKIEMEKFVKTFINSLKLSVREHQVLTVISQNNIISKGEILDKVSKTSKIPGSTTHSVIKNFLSKGVLSEVEPEVYKISRKVKLFFKYYRTH